MPTHCKRSVGPVAALALLAAGALLLTSCFAPEQPKEPAKPAGEQPAAAAKDAGSGAAKAPAPAAQPAKPAAQAQPAGDRTLKVGMFFPPKHVDPHRESVSEVVMTWKNVYESLLDVFDDQPGLQPVLATSWEIQDGGKVLLFKLRQGVKFHDGSDFNAEAVKFNFERLQKINLGPAYILRPLDRVEIVDPYTVRLVLKQPFLPMLSGLALVPMISPKSVKDHDEGGDLGQKWYTTNGVGTGAYKIESVNLNEQAVLARHEQYWRGWQGQHFDRVILKMVFESAAQRLQLEKGDLDIAVHYSASALPTLERNPSITVHKKPAIVQYFLRMNNAGGPTAKKEVRQALNYAWNPETIQKALSGLAAPSDGAMANELVAPHAKLSNPYKYDLAKAKELLAQAGYPNGFTTTLYQQKDNEEARILAEAAQAVLAQVGVKVNIQVMPFFNYVEIFTKWYQTKDPNNVPGLATQFRTANFPDAYAVLFGLYNSKAQTGDGRNYTFYNNPRVDELLDQATRASDIATANKLYAEAAQTITDDAADLFSHKRIDVILMRSDVKGFKFNPIYWQWINYYRLYRG